MKIFFKPSIKLRCNIQHQHHNLSNNKITREVVEVGPAQSMPIKGYLPNTDRRLFLVDSYGSKYDLKQSKTATTKIPIENSKDQTFYSNPAFKHSQQHINLNQLSQQDFHPQNFDEMEIASTVSSKSHTEEIFGNFSLDFNY